MNTTDESIKIRFATADDWQAIYERQSRAWGLSVAPRDIAAWKQRLRLDDILLAEDVSDPRQPLVVGTSLCYRLRLTVPGGARLPAAWLAMVTVAPTHQGRGIWEQLSTRGFKILHDRGYPIICGVPTQPMVFEVLGAGVASYARTYDINRRFAKLRSAVDSSRAREVTVAQARRQLPELYDRWCATTPGALSRDSAWWADFLEDRPSQRDNGSQLNFMVHPDGFMTYRTAGVASHAFRPPFGVVLVQDFCAITDEAHTELLAGLLGLEMFGTIEIEVAPDDPLPLKFTDQGAVRTKSMTDFLAIRIMDVPEVLGARSYSADADVALEVTDPLGAAGGRFLLQTRDGVGKCLPDDGPAEIQIGLGELATIYMNAHCASELHRANRIAELQNGALAKLDAVFSTEHAPYCGTLF